MFWLAVKGSLHVFPENSNVMLYSRLREHNFSTIAYLTGDKKLVWIA